jgi:hypothetical protein
MRDAFHGSCSQGSRLPWGGLGPNTYADLPFGGLSKPCAPARMVRRVRGAVVVVKG